MTACRLNFLTLSWSLCVISYTQLLMPSFSALIPEALYQSVTHSWFTCYLLFQSTVVDCGTLNATTNGDVSINETTFQQTAVYTCNMGYNLTGNSIRMCQATGAWSGSEPTCQSEPNLTIHRCLCSKL